MPDQSSNPYLLEALSLSHAFDYPLFEELSFTLAPTQSIAIVGKSGSGKSTLLHICSTLLKPQRGIVKLFGKSIYDLSSSELLAIRREKIGIVFQSHYLFKGFTAIENIEVAALLARESIDRGLIDRFGIAHVIDKKVSDLSGGEQQRVSIARVLTKKPKLIFADEPTGNLDAQTAKEVMDVVFNYIKEEKAALMLVTHDPELAARCDRTYKLQNSSLVPLG